MGANWHCALRVWWTEGSSRVTLDTSLGMVCFPFVYFVLDSEQGYCSRILCTVPSRVRGREEGLGSTVQMWAVKFNPKRDQTSKVRKTSTRTDLVNLFGCLTVIEIT